MSSTMKSAPASAPKTPRRAPNRTHIHRAKMSLGKSAFPVAPVMAFQPSDAPAPAQPYDKQGVA